MSKRPPSAESGYCSSDDNNNFLPQVQATNRRDLEDDGSRDWQEQALALLDNNYPDWNNPNSTTMVPAAFPSYAKPDKGRLCEKQVYDLLQDFGEKYKEPMFVVHSHKFKELIHSVKSGYSKAKKWVIGEHDFLIIHRSYGPIFLQVKARDEKDWLKAFQEAQKQIDKDKESLKIFLEKQFDGVKGKCKRKHHLFDYPGFVVMPNCRRPKQTSVPHDNGVFRKDCMNLESFRSWWDENVVKDDEIDQEIYKELLVRFVALVHFEPSLNMQIEQSSRQIAFYTKQQLEILVKSPPQQWITGPAGSGKTVLLIKKVLELAEEIEDNGRKERILVLAFNKPLRDYLFQTLKKSQPFEVTIDVMTYCQFLLRKEIVSTDHFNNHSLNHKEKCNEVEANYIYLAKYKPPVQQQYQHIFIDEGQDLYGEHWPGLLEHFHNKPDDVPDGVNYFWVMYDSNQHVQPVENKLPFKYFRNAHRLTQVLRNTKNIFNLSKKYFVSVHQRNSEIELAHSEVGLNITWVNKLKPDSSNGLSLLIDEIKPLVLQTVQKRDIVVLARTETISNKLRAGLIKHGLGCQNAEDRIKQDENEVIVESVRRFKGLESKVVILYDPNYTVNQDGKNQARELMYVAVSRCLCYLIIISTENGCKWLKSETGIRDLSFPSQDQSQPNRAGPSSSLQPRAEHHLIDKEPGCLPPETMQLSSMEEKKHLQQGRCHQQASQSKIYEPGDKYIPDSVRENVFNLLTDQVTFNLQLISSGEKPPEILVTQLLTKIEYDIYKKHKGERNSRKHTKELRQLKAEIVHDNERKRINPIVHKTYEELKMRTL